MATIEIGTEETGVRLDRVLRKRLKLMTLSDIYSLIRKGGVKVNGRKVRQDYRLVENDHLELFINESELSASGTQTPDAVRELIHTEFFKRNFNVIYEDNDLLACNKPYGLVVHAGTGHAGHDTLIDLALSYLQNTNKLKSNDEPALVHRLDRDTSGVILIAKSKRALRALHERFRERDLVKQYIAICHNRPPDFEGVISVGMTKTHQARSGTKMKVDSEGVETQSRYSILEHHNDLSRLEILLETGKTHQIRVHMAHIKAPIVGDVRYGDHLADNTLFSLSQIQPRLFLHSRRIIVPHPSTGKRITIDAPEPKEFSMVMRAVE